MCNKKLVALGILMKLGFTAESAVNGQEALEKMKQKRYHLILMDCQMPILDGYQTTERIRSGLDAKTPHDVPIIAMTAHALAGDKDKCLAAGMDDYLAKPVDPQEISDLLDKWLLLTEGEF